MKYKILLLSCLWVPGVLFAGTIYRWVDDQKQVHFSDTPHENAQVVDLPDAGSDPNNDTESSVPASADTNTPPPAPIAEHVDYQSVSIKKPAHEETLRNADAVVDVEVECKPALQTGDNFLMMLDGKSLGSPQPNKGMKLTNMDRGEHTLQVFIVDAKGKKIREGKKITIFMQPPFIRPLKQNNPVKP